jgi:hypothetical protein
VESRRHNIRVGKTHADEWDLHNGQVRCAQIERECFSSTVGTKEEETGGVFFDLVFLIETGLVSVKSGAGGTRIRPVRMCVDGSPVWLEIKTSTASFRHAWLNVVVSKGSGLALIETPK